MRTDGHEVVAVRRALSRRAARAPRAVRCRGRRVNDDGAAAGALPAVGQLVVEARDLRVLLEARVGDRDLALDNNRVDADEVDEDGVVAALRNDIHSSNVS